MGTHPAEEMSDEDDQLSRCNALALVQLFEWPRVSLRIKHEQVSYSLQICLRRQIIVDVHIALEIEFWLVFLQHGCCAARRERRRRRVC